MKFIQSHPGNNYHTDDRAKIYFRHSALQAPTYLHSVGMGFALSAHSADEFNVDLAPFDLIGVGEFGEGRPSFLGSGTKWTGASHRYGVYKHKKSLLIIESHGGGEQGYFDEHTHAIELFDHLCSTLPPERIWDICYLIATTENRAYRKGRDKMTNLFLQGRLKRKRRTLEAVPEPVIRPEDIPDCEWSQFLCLNGRIPLLGDSKKPWEYRGWLLYYRLLLEEHPQVAPRWNYWARTKLSGKLVREPIPALNFDGCGSGECFKMLELWLHTIDRRHDCWSPMEPLLDWLLWGFGLTKEPPKMSAQLNEDLYSNVNIGPWLLNPYDYLGEWIADQKGKWNPHAFFPTPHIVVEMMVRMTLDLEGDDMRSKTVMDPAVGSGRMLLHASNFSLRLYGMDMDPLLVKTCLVNGALYAPWMVSPFSTSYFSDADLMQNSPNIATGNSLDWTAIASAGS